MKFLIQTIDNKVPHDFSLALIEAIKYQRWKSESISYFTIDLDNLEHITGDVIPIGSVEFVLKFMELRNISKPCPKNIPEELIPYAGRKIWNGYRKDVSARCFIKSWSEIKSSYNGLAEKSRSTLLTPDDHYQISEVLPDIQSEWRAFVFKGKLVGLHNYLGDFTIFPGVDKIGKMIQSYKNAPVAYTLDVFVLNLHAYVMEVHDFFSVGFYGFSDYRIIPTMFSQWFYQYKRRYL